MAYWNYEDNSDLKKEVELRRLGRMSVFIKGEKTSRNIMAIEPSLGIKPAFYIPETFINERWFETMNGDIHIVKDYIWG